MIHFAFYLYYFFFLIYDDEIGVSFIDLFKRTYKALLLISINASSILIPNFAEPSIYFILNYFVSDFNELVS